MILVHRADPRVYNTEYVQQQSHYFWFRHSPRIISPSSDKKNNKKFEFVASVQQSYVGFVKLLQSSIISVNSALLLPICGKSQITFLQLQNEQNSDNSPPTRLFFSPGCAQY